MSGLLVEVRKTLVGQSSSQVIVGQVLAFTIEVINRSPRKLVSAAVYDVYDLSGLEYLGTSISKPEKSEIGNNGYLYWADVTADLGNIPSGGSVTFSTSFRVIGHGSITNIAGLGAFIDGGGITYPAPAPIGESLVVIEAKLAAPEKTYLPLIAGPAWSTVLPPCDLQAGCGIDVIHPKGMAVHSGQDALYVTSRDTNRLVKVSGRTGQVIISVATGSEPWDVVINEQTQRIYVSNYASADVWVYDIETLQVIAQIPVGTQPAIMDIFPALDTVAVAVRGLNGVAFIEGLLLKNVLGTDGVGPYGLAANRINSELIVTNRDSGTAKVFVYRNEGWVLEGPTLEFDQRGVPFEAIYNPANGKLYIVYWLPNEQWTVRILQREGVALYRDLANVRVGNGGDVKDPDVGGQGCW